MLPKILSPANSFESAVRVIRAGADEIYCGVSISGKFRNFILYRGPGMGKAQLPTCEELARIVKYAHQNNVSVMLAVNEPFMSEALQKDMKNHIRSCLDTGVDALMIGDVGVLSLVKGMGVDVPLIASTYFVTMNSESLDFLRKIGFSRVVLERQLTIKEVKSLVNDSKMDIEVFCHGTGCSNMNGNCYLYHCDQSGGLGSRAPKKTWESPSPCRWPYEIYEASNHKRRVGVAPILDAYTECSLCYLLMLVEAGVAGIKIVGRLNIVEYQEKITETYRELLNMIERQCTLDSLQAKIETLKKNLTPHYTFYHPVENDLLVLSQDFQERYCRQRRCYFSPLFDIRCEYAI